MDLSQHIDLRQELYLTTELKQGIAILQMSAVDLTEHVKQSVGENPFLDDDDWEWPQHPSVADEYSKVSSVEALGSTSAPQWKTRQSLASEDEIPFDYYLAAEETLADHLLEQLHLHTDDQEIRRIGEIVIGCLDGDGHLHEDAAMIATLCGASESEVEDVVHILQRFDPAGVATRSLAECLAVQLEARNLLDETMRLFLQNHLESFGVRNPSQIARDMGISLQDLDAILADIRTCNPHPGAQFGRPSDAVWPEVVVEKSPDSCSYVVKLQDFFLPHLRVNSYYKTIASSQVDGDAGKYLKEKLKEAESLISNIEYRKATLYKVACCIVELQADFFDYGPLALRPLTMEKVAYSTELSAATVSRIVNGNYMQTPRGMFELRYFFQASASSSMACDASQAAVKHRLSELVKAEDPAKPLSDQALASMLQEEGFDVARRTVNKYRAELGIPPKSFRKHSK